MRKARSEGRGNFGFEVPPEFQEMYRDLTAKIGAGAARKLVREHIAIVERRRGK